MVIPEAAEAIATATAPASTRAQAILVVDDEPQIRRAVRNALREVSDRVIEATTAAQAIDLVAAQQPELVVLDLGLPDLPGIEVCREIRRWSKTPIVVLSARHSEAEKVRLLDAGADDYITKPFSLLEFEARVRVQLRRAASTPKSQLETPVTIGSIAIDFDLRRVTRDGETVHLTPTEWKILRTLAQQAGRTLTHQHIFDAVWGRAYGNPQQFLRVHLTNLRRKVEPDPSSPVLLVTEPGVGYRFELPR
jgi:two-component system KDP operon response regulator KdpE